MTGSSSNDTLYQGQHQEEVADRIDEGTTKGVVGILGGGGFVGRYLVPILAKQGYLVKVGGRHPDKYLHLKTAAVVGKIQLNKVDVRSRSSLDAFIQGCDAVVDLVGILFERGQQTFEKIHIEATKSISELCTQHTIKQLIYVSALGVDSSSKSNYARTKAEAEEQVRRNFPKATIVRPSLLYGAEDNFFNRFAQMIRLSPVIPVFKRGKTRFQPLYVRDLAKGIAHILVQEKKSEIYEFGGAEICSFRDLLEKTMEIIGHTRPIVSMPTVAGMLLSLASKVMPSPLITMDQLRLLDSDSVCSGKYPGLKELGIAPEHLETILPTYLSRFK